MFRTSLILSLSCIALFRQASACSCAESTECEYVETPLATDYATPWETTLADDIAMLEVPQPGTWVWESSSDEIELDRPDTQIPAVATFVHDPESVRLKEYVTGGVGTICDDEKVLIDGTLTFTEEQGDVIVSLPITVERMDMATPRYTSELIQIPFSEFSAELHPLVTFEQMGVSTYINWFKDRGLHGEFTYFTLTMTTPTTGDGVTRTIALFEPEE